MRRAQRNPRRSMNSWVRGLRKTPPTPAYDHLAQRAFNWERNYGAPLPPTAIPVASPFEQV